jgi:photosystem II stability/assembly factor-like uncharacterized protein
MMNVMLMSRKFFFIFLLLVAFPCLNLAQELKMLTNGINTSLRGLSVVDENIVWCSGSNGKVAKTTDGGNSFQWFTVQGYEQRDFRDIHAFDSTTAVIIAIDTPAIILKTIDGGRSWYKVFEDKRPGMFLDAMHFEGKQGVVIGDPIDGKPFVAQSTDKGESWQVIGLMFDCQLTINGEAFFAASGSNIQLVKTKSGNLPLYVSGGMQSRLFFQDQCISLPMQSGKSYTGANGLIYAEQYKKGVVVGGDFSDAKRGDSAMVFFEIGEKVKVGKPISIPSGYKSGASFMRNGDLLVCGTTGVAKWESATGNWVQISGQSAHAIQSDKNYRNYYLCGSKGYIAKIIN